MVATMTRAVKKLINDVSKKCEQCEVVCLSVCTYSLHGRNLRSNPVDQDELSSAAAFVVGSVDLQDTPLDFSWVQGGAKSGQTSAGGDILEVFTISLNNGPVVFRTVLHNFIVACAHLVSNSPEVFSEAEKVRAFNFRTVLRRYRSVHICCW